MSSFTSLATAVSGLRAAQTGLAVTGHNMANSEIGGYARQRVVQRDFYYQKIGSSYGGSLRKGLGTDTNAIQQIRNQFLDVAYRIQNNRMNFYAVKSNTGLEIETLLGELQGSYNFQSVINDIWGAVQELIAHVDGVETRDFFLATCTSFITKSNEVYDNLFNYQLNLDQQVRDTVTQINNLVSQVKNLNNLIRNAELSGDNANDYRDERNRCLDQLSGLIPIEYQADSDGVISIFSNGHQLLSQSSQNFMGLHYTSGKYPFVEPVFTHSSMILPANTPPEDFEPYIRYDSAYNAQNKNDQGALMSLIASRGSIPAYHNGVDGLWAPLEADQVPDRASFSSDEAYDNALQNFKKLYPWWDGTSAMSADDPKNVRAYEAALYNYNVDVWSINNALIPKTQMKLDSIVNKIVTLINDTMAPALSTGVPDPDAPFDLNGTQSYVEVFKRRYVDRWTTSDPIDPTQSPSPTLIPESSGDYYSQYSIGNLVINPILLDTEAGFNWLNFSQSSDREDNTVLKNMVDEWNSSNGTYSVLIDGVTYCIQDAYQKFVMSIATEVQESDNMLDNLALQVNQADNERNAIMGVSLDEEMSIMMTYQYAYNASARILNVIDSMIDRIVNNLGRVGL